MRRGSGQHLHPAHLRFLRKMDRETRIHTEGIKTDTKLEKWFDNFWYHYKWHTIITLFFVVVVLVCTLSTCQREIYDSTVLYAGPAYLDSEKRAGIEAVFEAVMPEDKSGDDEKKVYLTPFLIYSKEQIEAIEAETDDEGRHIDVDNSVITKNSESFYDYLMTGETSICLLDPSLYEALLSGDRLCEIKEGEYGVSLGDLPIYETYSALRELPEDTVVCFLRQNLIGGNSDDEIYENDKRLFEAIFNFYVEQ